jgi:hypothetical protein
MSKKCFFSVIVLLLGFSSIFGFLGCKSSDSSNPSLNPGSGGDVMPGPSIKIGEGSGWPSSKLPDYNHTGWTQPTGLSGVKWEERQFGAGATITYFLEVTFTSATVATKNSIDDYLGSWSTNTNWIKTDPNDFEVTYTILVGSTYYGVQISCNILTGGYIVLTRMTGYNPLA